MDVGPIEVIKEFMRSGYMFTINDVVEREVAAAVTPMFGYEALPLDEPETKGSLVLSEEDADSSLLETRPPVVTILGHVDHGKTTLLDAIRNSKIVAGEAGGITQHIGAYQVKYDENLVTFLDTPGHDVYGNAHPGAPGNGTSDPRGGRGRWDNASTEEAIDHARAADVPIVVAINKIDLPDSDPERVKRQLAEHNLLIEEWAAMSLRCRSRRYPARGSPPPREHPRGGRGRRAEGRILRRRPKGSWSRLAPTRAAARLQLS